MPGASAGVTGAGVPGSRGQPSGRPPLPSPRDFFPLCPIPGPLTGTGSYFWKFLFFFLNAMHPDSLWPPADGPRPRVRLDVPHSGIRSAPKRVCAGSEPLLTTARAVSPRPATPVFPRGPPPFPSAPRPRPAMALLRAPAASSAQPPRRARGSQRAGSGRPQLGSHPEPRRRAPGACAALLCGSTPVTRN